MKDSAGSESSNLDVNGSTEASHHGSPPVLCVRTDKIGDLSLTLASDLAFTQKGRRAHWLIQDSFSWLAQAAGRSHSGISMTDRKLARQQIRHVVQSLNIQEAVVFYAPFWIVWELLRAGVRLRLGRYSQWFSWLFYHRGLRQKRSQSEAHEAQYNWQLATWSQSVFNGDPHAILNNPAPYLQLTAPDSARLLERYDLRRKNYVVVHCGMAGSARNWPEEQWIKLIEKIAERKLVVLTGTAADEKILAPIKQRFRSNDQVRVLQSLLTPLDLLSVLKMSAAVVAPSTGVLHLAASLGIAHVGIYSPLRSQHPTRWAPRPIAGVSSHVVLPQVHCPSKGKCWEASCPHFDCMGSVEVREVFSLLEPHLQISSVI